MSFKFFNKKSIFITMILVLAIAVTACGGSSSDKVVVAGKDYTEQVLMVHLVSEVIEAKTDIEVDRKPFLGGTNVVFTSQKSGEVDIMVEYTGTGLISVLEQEQLTDRDEVYRIVKEGYDENFDIKWLEPLGFNNTYAITMREEMAEEMGIESISDLKEYAADFDFASVQEFSERDDGYDGMAEMYGIEFKDVKAMDPGLTYTAIKEKEVDASVSFTTDGRVPAFNLRILEDDKNFFPPYDAAITVRKDTLEKHPELEEALSVLSGMFTDEEMAKLNAEVDLEEREPDEVAKEWLKSKGIID